MRESNEYVRAFDISHSVAFSWPDHLRNHIYLSYVMKEKIQYTLCSVMACFSVRLVLESRSCCRAALHRECPLLALSAPTAWRPCTAHQQAGETSYQRGAIQLHNKPGRCQMMRCVINTVCVLTDSSSSDCRNEYRNNGFLHWSLLTFQHELHGTSKYTEP